MQRFGIDISRYQKAIQYDKLKQEGVEFVIIKCGGNDAGLYKDSCFDTHYKNMKALEIPVGAYFFGNATSIKTAIKEADYCASLLNGKQFEYPIYYDVESRAMSVLNRDLLTNIVKAFCERLEELGFYPGIYSYLSLINNNLNDGQLAKWTHWVACYSKNKPSLKSKVIIDGWQYGGSTNLIRSNKVAGVVCDQNYCYRDYSADIVKAGKNGFTKEAPKAPQTPKAPQYIAGKYIYNGVDYGPVFDATYYGQKNPDVVKVFGTSPMNLFKHFCEYGMHEHKDNPRQTSPNFNLSIYMNDPKNSDLRDEYGTKAPECYHLYYEHYCRFGKNEDRVHK